MNDKVSYNQAAIKKIEHVLDDHKRFIDMLKFPNELRHNLHKDVTTIRNILQAGEKAT
jgi:hypothetical protein